MCTLIIFAVISILQFFQFGDCLDCFTCTNVTSVSECQTTTTCKAGEGCFAEHLRTAKGFLLSYGCRPTALCSTAVLSQTTGSPKGSGSIVGRSVTSTASSGTCSECCLEHNCNRKLCQHSYQGCEDSPQANCAIIGTMMNICLDTQHAKTICRRFCGLCCYHDGSWTSWLSWSSCDVTCGNGLQTRDRTCTKPVSLCGGHDCVGPSQDTKSCSLQPCPVHGGWSSWTSWGSCSVTCGIGLQRRDRTCSNPYPDKFGDHCFGDTRDDQICIAGSCSDGGWSVWSAWSSCTRTCGEGIITRSRACDNPVPSLNGKYCDGDSFEVDSCNVNSCSVTNGGWGQWSDWTSCTATCRFGVKSRHRNCNSPEPSNGGKHCTGSYFEVAECNSEYCQLKSGTWSDWSDWTRWNMCMRYRQTSSRERTCQAGDVCLGSNSESHFCGK